MNQIQLAFSRINNLPPMIKSLLARNTQSRDAKTKRAKGWEAKLSFKTYHHLKQRGVMV